MNRCEECDALLGGVLSGLMHLQTVHTVRRRRISSDEEERRRAGFELATAYRFSSHGTRPGRAHATVTDKSGPLADLVYGDAATVRVVNKGRLGRKNPADIGFWLDPIRGEWLTESQAADRTPEDEGLASLDENKGSVAKVVPYVEDTKNICVIRLRDPVDEVTATSVRYALERGIETFFQLEDAELTSQALPDPAGRGRMLFIESAEGGAGVLRRLHDEPSALAKRRPRRHRGHSLQRRHRPGPASRAGCPGGLRARLLRLPAVLHQPAGPHDDRPPRGGRPAVPPSDRPHGENHGKATATPGREQ